MLLWAGARWDDLAGDSGRALFLSDPNHWVELSRYANIDEQLSDYRKEGPVMTSTFPILLLAMTSVGWGDQYPPIFDLHRILPAKACAPAATASLPPGSAAV